MTGGRRPRTSGKVVGRLLEYLRVDTRGSLVWPSARTRSEDQIPARRNTASAWRICMMRTNFLPGLYRARFSAILAVLTVKGGAKVWRGAEELCSAFG